MSSDENKKTLEERIDNLEMIVGRISNFVSILAHEVTTNKKDYDKSQEEYHKGYDLLTDNCEHYEFHIEMLEDFRDEIENELSYLKNELS